MIFTSPAVRTFLASFLVLFLEIALIRWMPAYIRLLAYFSNFILLASFLGIGVGCLLAPVRARLFTFFPVLMAAVVAAVYFFRLEVSVPTAGSIYFSSGTADKVVLVESTLLLPLLFIIVAALFATLAQRMGREMAVLPPLQGYTVNIVGSLVGVVAFALISWLELPPAMWFGVAFAAAVPLVALAEPGRHAPRAALVGLNLLFLGLSLVFVHVIARGALWSPYYKITLVQEGKETVVEVNNIFHQSMAPVEYKEYFYQWPYTVFGDSFENVLILGAGSGTDVAAALRHGAKHVDAVEIDPTIIRLGRERHPDRPYHDPRVTIVNDDARHFLRTTDKRYDLVVFALIDSLTMQSSFSGVRLESYMFTEESFRAVRDRLTPNGLVVVYNYFRERWLVDRLANTAAVAFGDEPRVHVHAANAFLGVILAGPRLATLTSDPVVPDRVMAFGQSQAPSPARMLRRNPTVEPATDDWPFLYLRDRHLPRHYGFALALILGVSTVVVFATLRGQEGQLVVAVLPARRRVHAPRNEIDHPVCAVMGLDLGCRLAGHCRRADDGASGELDRVASGDHACVAGGRSTPGAARAQLRHPGRPGDVRQPRGGIHLLCGPDVQPDPLRRSALRVGHQAFDLATAGLRNESARCDGGRRGRIPVVADRIQHPVAAHCRLLRRRRCFSQKGAFNGECAPLLWNAVKSQGPGCFHFPGRRFQPGQGRTTS